MRARTVAFITLPFVGYYFVDRQLSARYPQIPTSQLPKDSKLSQYTVRQGQRYFPYNDIFKATKKGNSIPDANLKFLSTPGISNLVANSSETTPVSSPSTALNSHILKTYQKKNYNSTIISWYWNPEWKIVSFFETISSYGYPWRLMNGGIHEILIVRSKDQPDSLDVYFSTAHQYNDKRDGKLIPNWVQSLHRSYARVILYLATKE